MVSNALGIPIAHNAILADHAQQHQVRIATQKGLEEMHDIPIKAHGPLHYAQPPGIGEPTVLQLTIQSAVLFSDPDWHQILTELLPEEFLGFPTGSPMVVVQYPGEAPKCKMYPLVLKSARTCALQSKPMGDQTTVMWLSRESITWKAQVFEMPISRPMPAIHVTDLQISKPDFLPYRIFDDMVNRYKHVLAQTFQCGAWKNRTHEKILAGFGCRYAPRYNKDRAGSQGPKVFLLEISH